MLKKFEVVQGETAIKSIVRTVLLNNQADPLSELDPPTLSKRTTESEPKMPYEQNICISCRVQSDQTATSTSLLLKDTERINRMEAEPTRSEVEKSSENVNF